MKKLLSLALGMMALVVATAQPVQAATISIDFSLPTEALDMPTADQTTGLVHENIVGTDGSSLYYRSPFEGTSLAGAKYTAVRKDASAIYNVGQMTNQVSFTWGSVDNYNLVKFYAGDLLVDWVSGAMVIAEGVSSGAGFVQVLLMTNFMFDRIEFMSYNNSFEYGNLQISAVPLPAALPLYGAGILLLGFLGWRRSKSNA